MIYSAIAPTLTGAVNYFEEAKQFMFYASFRLKKSSKKQAVKGKTIDDCWAQASAMGNGEFCDFFEISEEEYWDIV